VASSRAALTVGSCCRSHVGQPYDARLGHSLLASVGMKVRWGTAIISGVLGAVLGFMVTHSLQEAKFSEKDKTIQSQAEQLADYLNSITPTVTGRSDGALDASSELAQGPDHPELRLVIQGLSVFSPVPSPASVSHTGIALEAAVWDVAAPGVAISWN
jgi:hypothetical protein